MTLEQTIIHVASFVWLGLVVSLVVVAVHESDISRVWRKAFIAFLKLLVGSVVAIFLIEGLYEYTIFTYPFLVLLFGWLFLGDRLWRRWKLRRIEKKAAALSPDS